LTTITNTRELPRDTLRCFAMTKEQAEKFVTQYVVFWFYPLARTDKGYLYVLATEYEEKKQS
jgi:hypothetical protein